MFDLKWIRDNGEAFDDGLKKRGLLPMSQDILAIDERRRTRVTALQEIQARRNAASKEIGKAKAAKDDKLAEKLMKEVTDLKSQIQDGEEEERGLVSALNNQLAQLPNTHMPTCPTARTPTTMSRCGPGAFPPSPASRPSSTSSSAKGSG